jgi:hypothetical protein
LYAQGNEEMSLGLTYVALSRIKNFKDFLIKPFSLERIKKLSQSKSLKPRLDEELRVDVLIKETYDKYYHLFL